MIKEGKLDKYGRKNEKTPADYLTISNTTTTTVNVPPPVVVVSKQKYVEMVMITSPFK